MNSNLSDLSSPSAGQPYFPTAVWLTPEILRPFSAVKCETKTADSKTLGRCGFLALLTVTQALGIEILPIDWEQGLPPFAHGGQSSINQALVKADYSLAFKCIRNVKEANNLDKVIEEISVLGQPMFRNRRDIIQLEGVSWDVAPDGKVWPVLVFEKSEIGDLWAFTQSKAGKALSLLERIGICKAMAAALQFMHSNHIIHGDIRPENILIFQEEDGSFTSKLTDFGYSTLYADGTINMPISRPWNPPGHNSYDKEWKFSEASGMDIFSFGMVCLWLIYEPILTDKNVPQYILDWAASAFSECGSKEILQVLKIEKKLVGFAEQMLDAESQLDIGVRNECINFFHSSLSNNSLGRSWSGILQNQESPSNAAETKAIHQRVLSTNLCLYNSFFNLYKCHYKVRVYIYSCLKDESKRLNAIPDFLDTGYKKNIEMQKAVCYIYGFGVIQSNQIGLDILCGLGCSMDDVYTQNNLMAQEQETFWRKESDHWTIGQLRQSGYILASGTLISYEVDAKDAEQHLRQELDAIDRNEPHDDWQIIWLMVAGNLASVYWRQKRDRETAQLLRRCIDFCICHPKFGPVHGETIYIFHRIAHVLFNLEQWDEAVENILQPLMARISEAEHEVSNPKRLELAELETMKLIARAYRHTGRLEEAEELQVEVLSKYTELLGQEHEDTTDVMNDLAHTHLDQGYLSEAHDTFLQVWEINKARLGEFHNQTLAVRRNMAHALKRQDSFAKAAAIFLEVYQARKHVLGPIHQKTIETLDELADTYMYMNNWEESEKRRKEATLLWLRHQRRGDGQNSQNAVLHAMKAWMILTLKNPGVHLLSEDMLDGTNGLPMYLALHPEFTREILKIEAEILETRGEEQ